MAKATRQVVHKKSAKKAVRPKPTGSSFLSGIRPVDASTCGIRMALYGRSGAGKTTFACTFPKPLLLIRCGLDDGEKSVSNIEGVDVTPLVKKSSDLDDVIRYQASDSPYKTIVLDTASEFRRICLTEVLKLTAAPTQLTWGTADRSQYGDAAIGTKDRLRDLLDLALSGTNVIVVAQEGSISEQESTLELLAPSVAQDLGGSTVGFLNPACDYVLQMFIRSQIHKVKKEVGLGDKKKTVVREEPTGEYEYCLRTKIHDVYTVKFRAPKGTKLPAVIVDPDYNKFFKLVQGG